MELLGMISSLLPGLAFMFMGFGDKDGASDDDDKDKDKDKDDTDDDDDDDLDPTIKSLQKDPDGIAGLIAQKRSANAQAKDLRLELKKLKDAQDLKDQDDLKEKGKFEELSKKLEAESASNAKKAESRMILNELQVQAIALGIRNSKDVKLASLTGVSFDSDTYEVTGAKDAVEALKKESPYLFKDKKKDDDDDDSDNDDPAHEENKSKMKSNITKFDAAKTPNLTERFGLGEGKKNKKGK